MDMDTRLEFAKREKGGEGKDWESEISRCKLLHIGWINSKILLYSTGNYIQYPVINHNGKDYKKESLHVYINSLCYTAGIGTTL